MVGRGLAEGEEGRKEGRREDGHPQFLKRGCAPVSRRRSTAGRCMHAKGGWGVHLTWQDVWRPAWSTTEWQWRHQAIVVAQQCRSSHSARRQRHLSSNHLHHAAIHQPQSFSCRPYFYFRFVCQWIFPLTVSCDVNIRSILSYSDPVATVGISHAESGGCSILQLRRLYGVDATACLLRWRNTWLSQLSSM